MPNGAVRGVAQPPRLYYRRGAGHLNGPVRATIAQVRRRPDLARHPVREGRRSSRRPGDHLGVLWPSHRGGGLSLVIFLKPELVMLSGDVKAHGRIARAMSDANTMTQTVVCAAAQTPPAAAWPWTCARLMFTPRAPARTRRRSNRSSGTAAVVQCAAVTHDADWRSTRIVDEALASVGRTRPSAVVHGAVTSSVTSPATPFRAYYVSCSDAVVPCGRRDRALAQPVICRAPVAFVLLAFCYCLVVVVFSSSAADLFQSAPVGGAGAQPHSGSPRTRPLLLARPGSPSARGRWSEAVWEECGHRAGTP